MSEEPFDFGKVSSSCMIVGTALGLAISLVIALVITLAEGLGFALFFWMTVLLTLMLSVILMTACARTKTGDLFGVGRSLGLQKAEREGRLSAGFIAEQARAKAAELSHSSGAGDGSSGSISAKASEVAEKVKQAASGAVEQTKQAATDTVAQAKQAVGAETDASPPAERPQTAPEPAATAPAPPTAAATPGAPVEGEDDLKQIRGIGPQAAAALKELGVTRFDQIAAWTDEDIDRMDEELGGVRGRIRRDDWVGQARTLAAGQGGS